MVVVIVVLRVVEERGLFIGEEVGYIIWFDDCCNLEIICMKFVIDGVLLREMMSDFLLL